MRIRFDCPHCNKPISADPANAGKRDRCSHCMKDVTIPGEPPVNEDAFDPSRPGGALAARMGVSVMNHEPDDTPATPTAVKALLARTLQMLPPAGPAYRPSGFLPASGALGLLLGSAIGLVAGATFGAACGAAILGIDMLLGLLLVAIASAGWLVNGLAILIAVVTFMGLLTTFVMTGKLVGWLVVSLGQRAKNRSLPAAVGFSVVSALGAAALMQRGLFLVSVWIIGLHREFAATVAPSVVDAICWGLVAIGGIIAAWIAGRYATGRVRGDYFCESCNCLMEASKLGTLSLNGSRVLAEAMQLQDLEAVADVIGCRRGAGGTVRLAVCPSCGNGFFDLAYTFYSSFTNSRGENQPVSKTWLAGSLALSSKQVQQLLSYLRTAEAT